jgi:LemA protein
MIMKKIISRVLCCLMLTATPVLMMTETGCQRGIQKYDALIDADEKCNQRWSDVDAQLQRRADLIPNLVSVVRGSAAHEEKTLTEVMEARASATQIKMSGADFEDPKKMEEFQKAQEKLKGSLSRLMMVQEKYPDLQANKQFADLMTSIESTENRILQARKDYNAAVADFNKELRHVSGKIINPLTNSEFKPRTFFKADEAASVAPKVDFSTPQAGPSK